MASKKKPNKRKRIERTVKQYAYFTNTEDLGTVEELQERILNARNYMYSRLAGVNSYSLLHLKGKKAYTIRNTWVKDKELVEQFKLPARYWKMVLSEVIGSLKSKWANICNDIKFAVRNNDNLTEDEKFYLCYVCSAPSLFGELIVRKPIKRPEKIENLVVREKYVHNLLLRYVRRYKKRIPYAKSKTFQIDADMYEYECDEEGKVFLNISTHVKHKRIRLACVGNRVYSKNIRLSLENGRFTLSHTGKSKAKHNPSPKKNVIGLDKGYKDMLVSSSGQVYGANLNTYLSEETERLNEVNKKRNPYYAVMRDEKTSIEKAERIYLNNTGKVKYNRLKQKHDARVKSYINAEINRLLREELPHTLVVENLNFVSWDEKMGKNVRRKLSRWIKGYIDERLAFKCSLNNIKYEYVNPAYTSQECHECGCLGTRPTQTKFICSNCGEKNADENASKVIKKRLKDKEIGLYTPYKQVKNILEERTKTHKKQAVA